MGQTRGLEPPHIGTTIRGLNHLATPAICDLNCIAIRVSYLSTALLYWMLALKICTKCKLEDAQQG